MAQDEAVTQEGAVTEETVAEDELPDEETVAREEAPADERSAEREERESAAEGPTVPTRKNPIQTVGRRKSAVARVILRPGAGGWDINGRDADSYFPVHRQRQTIDEPFRVTETEGMYDVQVRANGGGLTGQADAIQLGVARALVEVDEEHRDVLRDHGLLTRDPRVVERKKPGRPKARKRSQFSKR